MTHGRRRRRLSSYRGGVCCLYMLLQWHINFEFPTWHINGASYAIQGETLGLPDRHRYSNQMMTVRDIQASDNGTTYSCSFLFGTIASSEATLTVLSASSASQGKYVLCTQNYTLTGLTNICHRNFNDKFYEFGNLWNH